MTGLNRDLAPLSEKAWEHVESEARDVLALHLAGRHLVDFEGPLGWEHSAIDLGRVEPLEGAAGSGAQVRRRVVRPLVELRVPFALERDELDRIDRGAASVDLDPLREAARTFAAAEDAAIFEGYADGDIPGIITDSTNEGVALPPLPSESARLPAIVGEALEQLREAGVAGPYAMALGPDAYAALARTTGDGGYPIKRVLEQLLDRPVVWTPSVRGGVVLSLRGGDFKLVCGRDAAIGYTSHDEKHVCLYLEESFSTELNGPEAAVALLPGDL